MKTTVNELARLGHEMDFNIYNLNPLLITRIFWSLVSFS